VIWVVQSHIKKFSVSRPTQISRISPPSRLSDGRFAIVTDVRWDAVDAGGASDESGFLRTAKSCGPDAPTLVSRSWSDPRTTVANKPGHRGEREGSRKTIARGMPGVSGVTVVTNSRVFLLHARLRARRAPGIPCAL
jgi:hypothetical protein